MHIDILTLFPEMFTGCFDQSILHRAQEKGLFSYQCTISEIIQPISISE